MRLIQPHEKELTGNWLVEDDQVRADPACERVQWLTQNVLVKIADSKEGGGWETLYQDPADSRLWERTYPQSEMHGGGPPQLKLLTEEEATRKYDSVPKSLKTSRF
jgi:hypothetical protein